MNLTKQYVAGFIENAGGFYIFYPKREYKRTKLIPQFKIVIQKSNPQKVKLVKEIIMFFKETEDIVFLDWSSKTATVYQITKHSMLKKFISFLDDNCILKKKYQDKIRKYVKWRLYEAECLRIKLAKKKANQ